MVYTSTYNVIFGGQVIENGDESLEYLPLDKVHCCPILTRILQMAFQTWLSRGETSRNSAFATPWVHLHLQKPVP